MSNKAPPSPSSPVVSRRLVFTGVGTAGALAAAAAVLPLAQQATKTAAAATQADSDAGGYQLTEHVKRYYQTARV